MGSIFKCFRKKTEKKLESGEDNNKIVNDINFKCPKCKSHLVGTLQEDEGKDGTDGRPCSKLLPSKCTDTRSSQSSSVSDSSIPESAPIFHTGNQNNGFITDYRPMAQNNLTGMSYMPVSKSDPNYNMNHIRRGKAVVFNFDKWNNTMIPSLDLQPRVGSQKDKKDLSSCLEGLSFDVQTHDNLPREKFDKVIEKLRKENHSDADCLVVAILTHGEKNGIFLSDGSLIPVNTVWEKFEANKCPSLAGKPKIFIIQACRGERYDHGTALRSPPGQLSLQNDVTDAATFTYVIPNASDVIVAFSCPPGHFSWRSPEKGSWFIQSICKVFNEDAYNMDLKSLFTTVSREVALNYESITNNIDSDKKKQVPSTSSTLIRNVYFAPKQNVRNSRPTAFSNHAVNEYSAQDYEQGNNSQQVSLQDVKVAIEIAQVQTSIRENSEGPNHLIPAEIQEIAQSPTSPNSDSENQTETSEASSGMEQSDSNDEIPLINGESINIVSKNSPTLPCP